MTFYHNNNFLKTNNSSSENSLVDLVIWNFHVIYEFFSLIFCQSLQKVVVVKGPANKIFKSYFVNLLSHNSVQRISSQNKTNNFIINFYGKLSHCVIVKGLFTKAVTFKKLSYKLWTFENWGCPLFDIVVRRSGISFLHYNLILFKFFNNQRCSNDVFLLFGKPPKKPCSLKTFSIFRILFNNTFFDSLPKSQPINHPKFTLFPCSDWWGSLSFVQQRNLAKT